MGGFGAQPPTLGDFLIQISHLDIFSKLFSFCIFRTIFLTSNSAVFVDGSEKLFLSPAQGTLATPSAKQ